MLGNVETLLGGKKKVEMEERRQWGRGREGKEMEGVAEALGRNSGGGVKDVTDCLCPGLPLTKLPLPVVK